MAWAMYTLNEKNSFLFVNNKDTDQPAVWSVPILCWDSNSGPFCEKTWFCSVVTNKPWKTCFLMVMLIWCQYQYKVSFSINHKTIFIINNIWAQVNFLLHTSQIFFAISSQFSCISFVKEDSPVAWKTNPKTITIFSWKCLLFTSKYTSD